MLLAARIRPPLPIAALVLVSGAAGAAEPAPTKAECIAASESGQDLRVAGKLHDARTPFTICVAASCPGPIREDCSQRLDDIRRAMPSVMFEVMDSAGKEVPGVAITMDGQPVPGSDGALELDPGEHVLTFEAPGFPKTGKKLVIVEGVKLRRDRIVMAPAEAAQSASTTSQTAPEAPARAARPPTLALVAFGVGGAGLLIGVTTGLVAGGKHSTLAGECNNNVGTCAPRYADDLDAFHTWRTVSTMGYVIGVLGAAGGAVLWLTTPKPHDATATGVWLGPASAGIAGKF